MGAPPSSFRPPSRWPSPGRRGQWLFATALALLTGPAACTFLVSFEDHEPTDDDAGTVATGTTATTTTTTPPPPGDGGINPCILAGGARAANGTVAIIAPTDRNKVCCNGTPTQIDTNANCGACGLTCGSGTECALVKGYFYCRGCGTNHSLCGSNCCSDYADPKGLCAASTCSSGDAGCIPGYCENFKAKCRGGYAENTSFACAY